jgi:hypothetical protein
MAFHTNVFINCPFDEEYLRLLRPTLFTVIYLGFTPKIALEGLDSSEPRIKKIISLIENSKFSIHDLSRIRAESAGDYSRFNMPFELGVDVGCRMFKGARFSTKKVLILETENYRYQRALSDLSGSDIMPHHDEPREIVAVVRNWLATEAKLRPPGPSRVYADFLDFMALNYKILSTHGFSKLDIERLPAPELMDCVRAWIRSSGRSTVDPVLTAVTRKKLRSAP